MPLVELSIVSPEQGLMEEMNTTSVISDLSSPRQMWLPSGAVLEVSLQTLVRSQPAGIGSPIGWRTIGPASSVLGFGRGRQSL